eukprot:351277-Chlamydomonas_euryale.AAC.8
MVSKERASGLTKIVSAHYLTKIASARCLTKIASARCLTKIASARCLTKIASAHGLTNVVALAARSAASGSRCGRPGPLAGCAYVWAVDTPHHQAVERLVLDGRQATLSSGPQGGQQP